KTDTDVCCPFHVRCNGNSDATVFFFQAEDGIRDDLVTGVQTCALPISTSSGLIWLCAVLPKRASTRLRTSGTRVDPPTSTTWSRSEERRVGKECRCRWEAGP